MAILSMRHITKRFPGVLALDDVDLSLEPGEILGLIGENGAGKSTLLKILGGVHRPDAGSIEVDGQAAEIHGVSSAMQLGISLIHQELNLAENLDVAANIFLGREPSQLGWIRRGDILREARRICDDLDFDVQLTETVGRLPPGRKQLVEIAKALSMNTRILIMDEPTSSLSEVEAERLFEVVRKLRGGGVSIIYVTHRLWELRRLADRVEVLRDGKNAGALGRDELEHDRMVELMVGRNIESFYVEHDRIAKDVALRVEGLTFEGGGKRPIDFALRRGETLGVAGLVGAGRSEMAEALFGLRRVTSGRIELGGRNIAGASPREALRAGLGLVPEDRKLQGLILQMSVEKNIGLAGAGFFQRLGFLDRNWQHRTAERMIEQLKIRTPSASQLVKLLSGGNQQKVVMGKWLALDLEVLIIDEPTRGVDIGAKAEIYALMRDLASRGVGILMISSEMEELLHVADRALVLHEGDLAGELARSEMSEESIMHLATGGATVAGAA